MELLNSFHELKVEAVETRLNHRIAAEPLKNEEANLMRFHLKSAGSEYSNDQRETLFSIEHPGNHNEEVEASLVCL